MNFLKSGIFNRNGPGEAEPEAASGGVLAVWGSPGSGKTVTAVKLAKALAEQKRNVLLLLCDATAPMLPCVCPPAEIEGEHSLGSIFAAAHVSESLVRNNCVTCRRLPFLALLGMRKGENEYSYPPCSERQATELLQSLRSVAPYVIVDCSSYIANDVLSAVALMEADSVLRLGSCDLKAVSYFSSQLPLLRDARWDADRQYKVASNVKPGQAQPDAAFALPYSAELEQQYLEGDLLADLGLKDSRAYRKELSKILEEVFSV